MAEETLDAAVKAHKLHAGLSRTVGLMLDGGKDWTPTLYIRLVQDYGLENEVGFQNPDKTITQVIVSFWFKASVYKTAQNLRKPFMTPGINLYKDLLMLLSVQYLLQVFIA